MPPTAMGVETASSTSSKTTTGTTTELANLSIAVIVLTLQVPFDDKIGRKMLQKISLIQLLKNSYKQHNDCCQQCIRYNYHNCI